MPKLRMGTPKLSSRFICIDCLQENKIGEGIQRKFIREKFHIKNLYCLNCKKVTQNIELRYCDSKEEILEKAIKLHNEKYTNVDAIKDCF